MNNMKKLIAIIALGLIAQLASAKAFDSVFNQFKRVENAEYVKMPGILVRLGMKSVAKEMKIEKVPMEFKLTGLRVLELSECSKSDREAFSGAVEKASRGCELMLEATDDGDTVSIWLEPKNAKEYSKMIIYTREDNTLVELAGKFIPKK